MSSSVKLKLYTQYGCEYCDAMQMKLSSWGYQFDVVNIKEDVQAMAMMRLNNHRTVPQLYWNKMHVGPTNNDTMSFTKQMLEEALDLDNYQGGVESFK